jgi:primosomal protein N' (replication factor Y)
MSPYADVAFPLALTQAYTYSLPEEWRAAAFPGARVRAALGRRTVTGFLVRVHDDPPPAADLKPILAILDAEPLVPAAILELTRRLSRRYHSSWGGLLRSALPPSPGERSSVRAGLTPAGRAALAGGSLSGEEARIASLLAERDLSPLHFKRKTVAKSGPAVLARLLRKGFVETRIVEKTVKRRAIPPVPANPVQLDLDFAADPEVEKAVSAVAASAGRPDIFLFFGPGPRRTSAYFRCVRDVLAIGRQALFLYPEIGMSPALSEAFASGLGERAVFLHSRLTDREREEARRRLDAEPAAVVAGPRSALFLPLPRLGLIIVDEESDESHLQSDGPVFDARAGARMRAEEARVPLILGSDAPTVESYARARGEGRLCDLSGGTTPAAAAILDDRREPELLARGLLERIGKALRAGLKVVLFAPRKGYASFLFCPRCGFIPKCPRCESALTLYRRSRSLVCRNCGETAPVPAACPRCGGKVLEPRGAGVEAVEEELRRAFPGASLAAFDRESAPTRESRERLLERFASGAIDLLAGTPLLAHQPGVRAGLVILLNPEHLLAFSDFRAGQRMYVEIRRMLKALDPGEPRAEAVLQTSLPDHPVIRAAARGDYGAFFGGEIEFRRMLGYPPFAALAEIALWGGDARALEAKAEVLAARLRAAGAAEILGPAAVQSKGKKGVQLVAKAASAGILDEILGDALGAVRARKTVARYD